VSDSRLAPCQHSDNTELDCGHLSSCSDSEESSSEETLDIVLNAGGNVGGGGSQREMNDVDDETMFGDNDVSFVHTVPSVSLPEIDSLTYNEPSMESLTSLTTIRTPTQTSLTMSSQALVANTSASSQMSLEDEIWRLMNLREASSHRPSASVMSTVMSGSARLEAMASGGVPQRMLRSSSNATPGGSAATLQGGGVGVSATSSTIESQFAATDIAPLPSLGSCPSVSADKSSVVKPLPSFPKGEQLTRMPSFQLPGGAPSVGPTKGKKSSNVMEDSPSTSAAISAAASATSTSVSSAAEHPNLQSEAAVSVTSATTAASAASAATTTATSASSTNSTGS